MLSEELIARLRARAADLKTRSDAFEALQETLDDMALPGPRPTRVSMTDAAGGGAFGGLLQQVAGALFSGRGFNPQKLAEQVADDVRTGKTSMEEVFGGAQPGAGTEIYEGEVPSDTPRELPPPASQEEIVTAEAALGFSLPEDLKQLYGGIANGGFGPSVGFLPLAELVVRYRDFCAEPQGPNGETWPEHLLPVIPFDMGEACYDLETGKIVYWDPEELVDDEAGVEAWARSFEPWADSLAGWLETWLAEKPASQQLAEQVESGLIDNVRKSLAILRNMTPAERFEKFGLPEDGWEEQVCRNHGVDPSKVL